MDIISLSAEVFPERNSVEARKYLCTRFVQKKLPQGVNFHFNTSSSNTLKKMRFLLLQEYWVLMSTDSINGRSKDEETVYCVSAQMANMFNHPSEVTWACESAIPARK